MRSPARRGPAGRPGAEDRLGADQRPRRPSRRCHREGLVQGGRLPDPSRTHQTKPAQCAAKIQRAHGRGADGIRIFARRDRCAGRQRRGVRARKKAVVVAPKSNSGSSPRTRGPITTGTSRRIGYPPQLVADTSAGGYGCLLSQGRRIEKRIPSVHFTASLGRRFPRTIPLSIQSFTRHPPLLTRIMER